MTDHDPIDDLVGRLRGPPPPAVAPEWPRSRAPWVGAGLALAAALLATVLVRGPDAPRARGPEGGPDIDLRVAIGQDVARRSEGTARVGEQAWPLLGASASTRLWVWVEGPAGAETLGDWQVEGDPAPLRATGGLVSYRFDAPGRYTVRASSAGPGSCPPGACVSRTIEVE